MKYSEQGYEIFRKLTKLTLRWYLKKHLHDLESICIKASGLASKKNDLKFPQNFGSQTSNKILKGFQSLHYPFHQKS